MTAWITEMVRQLGYSGLALFTFIENIFPPIPSEVILPLGGYMVAQGQLTLVGVIVAGTVGSVAGAIVLYYIGKYFSQERMIQWADRHGGWFLLTRDDVENAFSWFEDHGNKAVLLCRLIPGVRSLISLPAGATNMALAPFLLYTTIGTALWSGILAYAGQQLGQRYTDIGTFVQWATYVVIAMLVLSIGWWIIQKRQQQQAG
ncbi:MAG: DedA family protein [Caldilineaceae bacterium]